MDALYFGVGFLLGNGCAYVWYLVGRNTKYQDQNITPPPAPIQLPKVKDKVVEPRPNMWVDELSDPSMAAYRPKEEL